MGLSQVELNRPSKQGDFCRSQSTDNEIISIQECQNYLKKYNLSDQRVTTIKDSLIGIVNSAIDSYLEEFK